MTTDLIVVQPDNLLFPVWNSWLESYHLLFNEIHIAIHKKNIDGWCFTDDIKENLLKIKNVRIHEPQEDITTDWRNRAVNYCIDQSSGERLLFMEQDFFIKKEKLIRALSSKKDVVFVSVNGRIHPCFLLVKRSVVNGTSKNFSASPPDYDHFGLFTREIMHPVYSWESIDDGWFHMAGLTQNYTLVEMEQAPNHDLVNLCAYNKESILKNLSGLAASEKYDILAQKMQEVVAPITEFL